MYMYLKIIYMVIKFKFNVAMKSNSSSLGVAREVIHEVFDDVTLVGTNLII